MVLDLQKGSFLMAPAVKNPPGNAGDMGLIPGSRRSAGEGHGSPLQYCLGNPKRSLVGSSPTGSWRVGHNLASKQPQQVTLGSSWCCMFCRVWQMHYVLCPPSQGHTEVSPAENPCRQPIHPSPNQSLATTLTVPIILLFPDFTFKE